MSACRLLRCPTALDSRRAGTATIPCPFTLDRVEEAACPERIMAATRLTHATHTRWGGFRLQM